MKQNSRGVLLVLFTTSFLVSCSLLVSEEKVENKRSLPFKAIENPEWRDILPLAQRSCIPCHAFDGFEKEEIWRNMREGIERRIALENVNESFTMPAQGTQYSRTFSEEQRKTMLNWLNKQGNPKGGGDGNEDENENGGNGGDGNDGGDSGGTQMLSAELKKMVQENCASCHREALQVDWWKRMADDAKGRIDQQLMPPNRRLSAEVRKKFIDEINKLNVD